MANITVIPATKTLHSKMPVNARSRRKVAGYARVSTDSEEQLTSYEAQVDYYTKFIRSNPDWEFVDVYTDEGISATNTRHRDGFNRMIADALAGRIEILLPTWIQSHDSFENEPPFEYPLNPLFSNRYQHRKRSEPLTFISCPEHFLC